MTSLSQRMDARHRLYGGESRALSRAFWALPDLANRYPRYLLRIHDSIRASAPLMEEAASLALAQASLDPVCAKLAPYYRRHAEEERGHDRWVVEDLEVLGVHREKVLNSVPSIWAAALVGAFHYWIRHAHPVAVMGYLVALEWSIPDPAYIEGICSRSGLPPESFTCLLHHARLDPGHRAEMEAVLDTLPIEPFHETLMSLGMLHSFQSLAALFRDLIEETVPSTAPESSGALSHPLFQETP